MLDMNTLLSLNKDPKSIDLHNMALTRMKNVKVDPSAKHDFIFDRMRTKTIDNIDSLYAKLNELEKNGVLDIWSKKFGKNKPGNGVGVPLKESTERTILALVENALEEMDGMGAGVTGAGHAAASGTIASSTNAPIAYMNGPGKNKKNSLGIIDKHPEGTHQDTHLGGN